LRLFQTNLTRPVLLVCTYAGEYIVRQGDAGDEFFVLESGAAEVSVAGKGVVKTMRAGEFFGESALMSESGLRYAIDYPLWWTTASYT
jgi:CRP-like cAMP-binding protein